MLTLIGVKPHIDLYWKMLSSVARAAAGGAILIDISAVLVAFASLLGNNILAGVSPVRIGPRPLNVFGMMSSPMSLTRNDSHFWSNWIRCDSTGTYHTWECLLYTGYFQ